MAAGCHAAVLVVLAFFPLLSSAFAPPASLSRLSLATSPLISSRIGRVGTPPLRESVSMKLSWEDKIGISVPAKAWGHDRIVVAKTIASEEELAPAQKSFGGLALDSKGAGQAPFWAAVIGGLTVIKMIQKKLDGRSILDNKDAKFIPQTEAELKALKVFACEDCGYEIMPARGREGKFFPDNFKCPICDAPKEKMKDIGRGEEKDEKDAKAKKEKAEKDAKAKKDDKA